MDGEDEPKMISKPIISKADFVMYMDEIKKHNQKIDKINKAICENSDGGIYSPPSLQGELMNLLVQILDDRYEAICYYIYETEYGTKWREGCFIIDGEDINLSNAENLYDFLARGMEK